MYMVSTGIGFPNILKFSYLEYWNYAHTFWLICLAFQVLYTNAIRKIQQTGGTVSPRNAASPIPPQLQAPPQPQLAQPPQLAHPGAGPGAAPGDLVLPEGWVILWLIMASSILDIISWEMKFTEAGEPYYVDHVTKKTQWQHPAITGPQVSQVGSLFFILIKQIIKLWGSYPIDWCIKISLQRYFYQMFVQQLENFGTQAMSVDSLGPGSDQSLVAFLEHEALQLIQCQAGTSVWGCLAVCCSVTWFRKPFDICLI